MQPVIIEYQLHAAVALRLRHAEKMHVVIVHAHEQSDDRRLLGLQVIGMRRAGQCEGSVAQIEPCPTNVIGEIGIESDETREVHHKHKVKIGKRLRHAVEPQQTALDVVEERLVLQLVTCGIGEKLRYKHRDAQLAGIKGYGTVWMGHAEVAKTLQFLRGTMVENHIEQGERLEKLLLDSALGGLGQPANERQPTHLTGKNIYNHLRLPVFD